MVSEIFTFLIFIGAAVQMEAAINPRGPTVLADFTNCVHKLIEDNFEKSGVLVFANPKHASNQVTKIRAELLKIINGKVKYSVEVMSPKREVDICDNYDEKLGILHIDTFEAKPLAEYFIIIIDTYKDFPYLASRLIRSRSWNPRAKFIILLFNFADEENTRSVERMLSCLFKYNVINITVVVPQANNIRNAIIYGWRPYDPPKYCGYFNETAQDRLYVENKCEKGALKFRRRVFEDRIPTDMKGCVLYINALERQPFVSRDENDANIEKLLITELVKRYNFKTSYEILINSFRGERESLGQWTGALKDLITRKGQLLLGGIFPDFDVHEDFECSSPYLADSYTWVVPRAHQSRPWIALIIIFTKLVWYSVIAGFSVCALFWRILGQLSRDRPYNRSISHCFLNAWICSLGFCGYVRPTTQSLRVFYVFFNIYCVLVVTGYQTKLIDVLKNPTFEYQIQNMEDLVHSGLKFGGFEELHDLFHNSSDPIDNFLSEHWIDVNDISVAMLDVAVHRNFSVLCSRMELAHISAVMPDLSDGFGNFKYYAFDLNMFSVPLEMVALRGFSFMDRFSKTLNVFKQSGLNEAVRRRYSTFNTRRRAKLMRSLLQEESDINPLSLQHLQGGFLILALGYVIGTFLLALEMICSTEFVQRRFCRRSAYLG